jgi:hypothetical protein
MVIFHFLTKIACNYWIETHNIGKTIADSSSSIFGTLPERYKFAFNDPSMECRNQTSLCNSWADKYGISPFSSLGALPASMVKYWVAYQWYTVFNCL